MASGKDYMFSALAIFCLEDYRPKTHLMDRILSQTVFMLVKLYPQLRCSQCRWRQRPRPQKYRQRWIWSKLSKLVQYFSLAALLLLAGDICPNLGWTYPVVNSPGLKIVNLNIRSLPKHLDEFEILMNDNPFDVMCLSETWLNSTWSDAELHIDGYNIIRTDQNNSQRGGGTAIYYNTKLMARQRSDLAQDIETTWLEITFPNQKKTLVCSLYKPPNADFEAFKASLVNALKQTASEGVETLILGDFNCDMLSKRLSKNSKELLQLFNMYQFNQFIKAPTYTTEHSFTTIDLAFAADRAAELGAGGEVVPGLQLERDPRKSYLHHFNFFFFIWGL